MPSYASDAIYFQNEGRENLEDCLKASMAAVIRHGLNKLVIFTARGEGLQAALQFKKDNSDYDSVQIIGVTFPQGKLFAEREGKQPPTRIEPEILEKFVQNNIPLVRARLPFDPIWCNYPTSSNLGQEMSFVGNTLNIFGGGMSLCIQACLMACDAGQVDWGEHIVVMSADTSLLLRAAPTDHFMTDLIVREVLCKPIFLTVTRKEEVPPTIEDSEHVEQENGDLALLGTPEDENTV